LHALGQRPDATALLAAFDVFALASGSEEAPIAVLEAMAAGLPVVSTNVGGLSELVVSGETGWLTDPYDEAAFAARLQQLAKDGAERGRLGAAGRRRAVEMFAPGPIVDRIEAVLAGAAALRPDWSRRR
jgi:glycosyltransferase involved in cell wall biosynthesis